MYRVPVLLALGANIGDPESQLAQAVQKLGRSLNDIRMSSLYRTEPVGIREQPDFFNRVIYGSTELNVFDLHRRTRLVEQDLGRSDAPRNGPRLIDIDILAYGELSMISADLTVPHPRLHERSFVLAPLAEAAPQWVHPVLHRTAAELLSMLGEATAIEKLEG